MVEEPVPSDESRNNEVTALRMDTVEELQGALEEEREKTNSYLDRLMRLQADYENYKKRTEKQINETLRYGNMRLILELLPILDDLVYASEAGSTGLDSVLGKGVEMTLKKLYSILAREGLSPIDAIGKPFDPEKHEAVSRVQVKGKDGLVVEEIRKGFKLRDTVLRPSLVTVAVNDGKGEKE